MTVRLPQLIRREDKDPLAAALEQEIFSEKASTLSRLTKKLEAALADLTAAQEPDIGEEEQLRRLAAAGEALWYVTIQRELCGLRGHREFYDFMNVPRHVRLHMGPAGSFASARRDTEKQQQEGM